MGICPERLTRAGVTSTWSGCLQHLLGSSQQSPVWQATQTADIAWAGQQFRRRFKPQHISTISKLTGKGLRPAQSRWLASWSQAVKTLSAACAAAHAAHAAPTVNLAARRPGSAAQRGRTQSPHPALVLLVLLCPLQPLACLPADKHSPGVS